MSPPEPTPLDAWMDARVEPYVDGTLSSQEAALFDAHLRRSSRWQEQVERARAIRAALRSRPSASAPASLPRTILQAVTERLRSPSEAAPPPPDRPA